MSLHPLLAAAFAAAALFASAVPARAATTLGISISDSVLGSVASISHSVRRSSDSSTGGHALAPGDYEIVRVAAAAGKPGHAQLTLRAVAAAPGDGNGGGDGGDNSQWLLIVPQALVEQRALRVGETIAARQRPYGFEFAAGQPREAFFLALHDEWYRELDARPVRL